MGCYLGHMGLLAPPTPSQCCPFVNILQNVPCTLGKKRKTVSFSSVYVCVKAKLTIVSFFYFFFYAPFPYSERPKKTITQFSFFASQVFAIVSLITKVNSMTHASFPLTQVTENKAWPDPTCQNGSCNAMLVS